MARIIGGEPADSSAWPWMAGLVYNRSISTNEVFCGASLIAKDWVLTAAHCVDDAGSASFDVIITKVSGLIYGIRMLQVLQQQDDWESHLVISSAGLVNLKHELDMPRNELY
ncbi:protein containing Peptidase S1 and S6, chymotrypsin/Hap domain, partial [methanotrophic bacterial endosymbiont of Bathymodiolus sp.]